LASIKFNKTHSNKAGILNNYNDIRDHRGKQMKTLTSSFQYETEL